LGGWKCHPRYSDTCANGKLSGDFFVHVDNRLRIRDQFEPARLSGCLSRYDDCVKTARAARWIRVVAVRLRTADASPNAQQSSFLCACLCVRPLPCRDYTMEIGVFAVGSSPRNKPRTSHPLVHRIFESFLTASRCPKPLGSPRKKHWEGVKLFGHGKSSNPKKVLKYSVNEPHFSRRKSH